MNMDESDSLGTGAAREFYRLAEQYDALDWEEINPSLHELSTLKDRYSSFELIAEGGMKRIFKVYDAVLKRHLAMAMLREDAPDELAELLIHEAWLTSQLDHPNIVAVHDVGILDQNRPYFTMDLKQGVTLNDWKQSEAHQGPSVTDAGFLTEALRVYLKICEAMSYAHSVNVIHLDLKPANIQIGQHGRVVICDWGLGMVQGHCDNLQLDRMLFNPDLLGSQSLYGQLKGTPGYMAPEQLNNERHVDKRTDIYGLGGILYKILTGSPPLEGSAEVIAARTRAGDIVPPHRRLGRGAVPEALSAVAMKALSADPSDRYQSVSEIHSEITRYLQGFATKAENAGILKELGLFYIRNKRFCILAASFLFILATGSIWFSRQLIEKEQAALEAKARAERNLMLYEAGQDELQNVTLQNVNSIIELSKRYSLQGQHDRGLAVLRTAIEARPDSPELARALGLELFKRQEFQAAIPWLEKGTNKNDIIYHLSMEYSPRKADGALLPADDLIELISQLGNQSPTAHALLLFDQEHRFNLTERARIIEAFLRLINPEWTAGWFEYDPKRSYLRVGGPGLKKLSYITSVIGGLRLRELDFSNSEVSSLWVEDKLAVEKLDISHTEISEVWSLKKMLHLQELTVSEGQLPDRELRKLPPEVKVIIRQ